MLAALASRHEELASALRDQVSLSEGAEASEDAVQCDRVLDGCWSGLKPAAPPAPAVALCDVQGTEPAPAASEPPRVLHARC
ncbi:hypothetical protein AB3662_26010 [Sorangium cellulosum]|uniref:hypothetical protein n=1 Tax=Sorangium cellulosum TaxID=56 RepID=UPI003D9A493C